jgi:hypothetical protein
MSDMVPKNPDDNPFIDNEALRDLTEKIVDILRPIGLTVDRDSMAFAMHPEFGMTVMIPALVRPSAGEKIADDRQMREDFNQMMAKNNEALVEEKKDEILKMLNSGDLNDFLFGGAEIESNCSHERRHPSTGHCLDCGEGLGDG